MDPVERRRLRLATRDAAVLRTHPSVARLVQGLSLGSGFTVYMVVCATPRHALALRSVLEHDATGASGDAFVTRWIDPCANDVTPLAEPALRTRTVSALTAAGMRDYDAVVLDLSHWLDDEAAAWGGVFRALDDARGAIAAAVRKPLVIVVPPELEGSLGEHAPGVWSMRCMHARFEMSLATTASVFDVLPLTLRQKLRWHGLGTDVDYWCDVAAASPEDRLIRRNLARVLSRRAGMFPGRADPRDVTDATGEWQWIAHEDPGDAEAVVELSLLGTEVSRARVHPEAVRYREVVAFERVVGDLLSNACLVDDTFLEDAAQRVHLRHLAHGAIRESARFQREWQTLWLRLPVARLERAIGAVRRARLVFQPLDAELSDWDHLIGPDARVAESQVAEYAALRAALAADSPAGVERRIRLARRSLGVTLDGGEQVDERIARVRTREDLAIALDDRDRPDEAARELALARTELDALVSALGVSS